MLAGYLFFRESWGLLVALPLAYAALRIGRRSKEKQGRNVLSRQLKDYLISVLSYLRAGYALENAMIGAEKEILTMYGADAPMAKEALKMSRRLELKIPPEQLWKEFGQRTDLSDGEQLSRVFSVAKRQGGDYLPVLKSMIRMMDERAALRDEIAVLSAGQRLEYYVMCIVPAGMLFFLNMSASDMTAYLYTGQGHILMAGILLVYALAVGLGAHMIEKSYEGTA